MLLDQNYFPHNPSNEFIVRAEYDSLHHSAKKSAGRRAECAFLAHSASEDPFCRVVECTFFAHSASGDPFCRVAECASLHHSAKKSAGRVAECASLYHSAKKSAGRRAECASFAHSANGYAAYQKRRSETAPGSRHTKFLGQSHSDLQKIQIIPRKMVV